MNIVALQQRTPEWHAWRNSGISASEADVIVGLSPYKTLYRLWAEKKGIILPEILDRNPHVKRGIRLEPVARRHFENRHDTLLLPICAESSTYPFLRASFDGIDDNGIPVEIKAPSENNFHDAVSDEAFSFEDAFYDVKQYRENSKLYKRYYYQVQQQILVAESDRAWLFLYLNDKEYLDIPILRDDDAINEIISQGTRFYSQNLVKNVPPEMDPARDIYIPSDQHLEKWLDWANSYHRCAELLQDYRSKVDEITKQQEDMKQNFLSLMGDFAHAETGGIAVTRYFQQGPIDYKAALLALVPQIQPDELEKFRKSSSERTRVSTKDEARASVPFSFEDMQKFDNDFWF